MNIFFEPVNVKQWNIFEKVKRIGHIEPFLATQVMNVGDLMVLHVGQQDKRHESGIYAIGKIIEGPFILKNHPDDYCNNKNTVNVKIIRMNYSYPYITHDECKFFINQFRTVHKIEDIYYEKILEKLGLELDDISVNNQENVLGNMEYHIKSDFMYVGITDTKWFNFVREKYNDGVLNKYINFWTHGKKEFKALSPGELFLFKLHNNVQKNEKGEIVGGAYFCGYEKMELTEAWKRFGNGNGTSSLQSMKDSILGYRERNSTYDSSKIGCIILKDPFFFNEWIDEPVDWNKNIVSGKKYETLTGVGKELLQVISDIVEAYAEKTDIIKELEDELNLLGLEGEEKLAYIKVRVNQSVFREQLLQRYKNCCLCKVEHASLLRASHIKPWADSSAKEKLDVNNGLLLCPNHDALFDGGFISFDDNGEILISERLNQFDKIFMNVNSDMKIELNEGNKAYMNYHRKNIFKK